MQISTQPAACPVASPDRISQVGPNIVNQMGLTSLGRNGGWKFPPGNIYQSETSEPRHWDRARPPPHQFQTSTVTVWQGAALSLDVPQGRQRTPLKTYPTVLGPHWITGKSCSSADRQDPISKLCSEDRFKGQTPDPIWKHSRMGAGTRALAPTGEQSGRVRTHGPGCRWPHAPQTAACAVWWQSPPCAALPSPGVLAGGSSGSRPCGRRWRDERSPHPCCPAPRGSHDSSGSQPLITSPRATLTQ